MPVVDARVPSPPDLAPAVVDAARDAAVDAPAAHAGGKRPAGRTAAAPMDSAAAGTVSVSKIAVGGDVSKADAEKAVRARAAAFRACYQGELATHPKLKGRMVLELTVAARGNVALADVKTSTFGGGDTEICVGKVARDLRFPPRQGSAESTVSFAVDFR